MSNKHQELEAVVAGYLEIWEKEFREFAQKAEAQGEELRERQERELDEFDARAPAEIGVIYRKRSPRLLALRLREARQCLLKEFPGAHKTKIQADKKEEAEVDSAIEKTRRDFLFRRDNLISEQEEVMNAFTVRIDGIRRALILKRDRRLAGFLRRMKGLGQDLGYKLDDLKTSETEICDPDPDQERIDYTMESEMAVPIPEFRTAVMSLDRKGKRTRSAPRSTRRVVYRRLQP
jgi:hypothetical protein